MDESKLPRTYCIKHTVSINIKSLTKNTELISITFRLEHGISYSLIVELSTEIAFQKLEAVEEAVEEECMMGRFTIEVDNNIGHLGETLSGTKKCNISSHYSFVFLRKLNCLCGSLSSNLRT